MQVAEITPQGPLCAHERITSGVIPQLINNSALELIWWQLGWYWKSLFFPARKRCIRSSISSIADVTPLFKLIAVILGLWPVRSAFELRCLFRAWCAAV